MKIYIAGPMSGIKQFNYPTFHAAAKKLRKAKHEVVSPAEMDSPEIQALVMKSTKGNFSELGEAKETWGDMLAADVKLIADEVDALFVLPGWQYSRGARLEAFVAVTVGKRVYEDPKNAGIMCLIPDFIVLSEISKNVINQGDVSRYEGSSK